MFVEAVFESSFGFTYVLFGAVVALYHVLTAFVMSPTPNVLSRPFSLALIDYLHKRGYNRYFLQREIQRVNNITRIEALVLRAPIDTSTLDKPERVPFVITYNPALRSISSIIRKRFHILISSSRCYNVFKAAPIVAYRRSSTSNIIQ